MKLKKFIYLMFVVLFIMAGCSYTSNYTLTDDDKLAYELTLQASYQFKNPSSVRIISGTVLTDQALVRLSATNSYGAITSGYYWITDKDGNDVFCVNLEDDGLLLSAVGVTDDSLDNMLSLCNSKDGLNTGAINKELDTYWDK